MIRLSVNVNKVATLRNSRGGDQPRVLDAVDVCLRAGAAGITVHPRADQRHITPADVRDIAKVIRKEWPGVEYNVEGDPRPDWIHLVEEVRPDQCTLVPVMPGEITSQAGWTDSTAASGLPAIVSRLKGRGIRTSLFVDPVAESIRLAASSGVDRVELYTEPFARAFERGADRAQRSLETYAGASRLARALGMGVNAGHDLDLDNLVIFRDLPHLDEVSIGHAIMSRALFRGLETVVREYLNVLAAAGART
jgi:pyridoxine 5-phosphate synthase